MGQIVKCGFFQRGLMYFKQKQKTKKKGVVFSKA